MREKKSESCGITNGSCHPPAFTAIIVVFACEARASVRFLLLCGHSLYFWACAKICEACGERSKKELCRRERESELQSNEESESEPVLCGVMHFSCLPLCCKLRSLPCCWCSLWLFAIIRLFLLLSLQLPFIIVLASPSLCVKKSIKFPCAWCVRVRWCACSSRLSLSLSQN